MIDSTPSPIPEEAVQAFAREINHATHRVRSSDEAAPKVSVLLPTGVTARRVFVVGALVCMTDSAKDDTYRQEQIVNPTGELYIHAEESQSESTRMLREIDLPTYTAIVGSPRLSSDVHGTVYVSLHPEHLMRVDEAQRNQWLRETARRTLDRIEAFDHASSEEALLAQDQYGADIERYRQAAVMAQDMIGEA